MGRAHIWRVSESSCWWLALLPVANTTSPCLRSCRYYALSMRIIIISPRVSQVALTKSITFVGDISAVSGGLAWPAHDAARHFDNLRRLTAQLAAQLSACRRSRLLGEIRRAQWPSNQQAQRAFRSRLHAGQASQRLLNGDDWPLA